jgi:glycosyltransferase involved in cell wall biosynthesis
MVRDEGIDFRAYLVGSVTDDAYLRNIRRLVRRTHLVEHVCICPSITDAQLADCYSACDVFVLPSRQETSPLAILEAMYAGLPIIATRVGGIPELVPDGVRGYLVEPARPDRLAEKLGSLLRDDAARARFRERNEQLARRLTWRSIAERTLFLYENLVSAGGRNMGSK